MASNVQLMGRITYEEFAQALVEIRKAGPDVQLLIYRPANRPS
jgi:hypothetical protein